MSLSPDAQIKVLTQTQDALRHGRQLLERLSTELFGAFVSAPAGSTLAVTMQEIKDAETSVQTALIGTLSPLSPSKK